MGGPAPCFLPLHGCCTGGSWVPLGGEVMLKCTFTLAILPELSQVPGHQQAVCKPHFPAASPQPQGGVCGRLFGSVRVSGLLSAGLGWRRALAADLPAALLAVSPLLSLSGPRGPGAQKPVMP